MAKSKSDISLNDLKAMLPQEGEPAEQEATLRALSSLSQEDRDLLAAVQESPFRLTTLEQFREFPANTEVFHPGAQHQQGGGCGWRYLAQHLDVLLPPELLDAIDPVPFGNHAADAGGTGLFYEPRLSHSPGDEWEHERPGRGRRRKSPPSRSGWSRAGRNVPIRARRSPIREKPALER